MSRALPRGRARLRHRVPVLRAVSEPDDRRQRRATASSTGATAARRSRARVEELLTLVGLPDAGAEIPEPALRRPAAARSRSRARCAARPGLLLLDEPLSALDASSACACAARSAALQQRLGVTTIMVTHDQEEALSMADRIVVMNQGRIEQVGTPRSHLRNAGDAASPPISSARSTCSPRSSKRTACAESAARRSRSRGRPDFLVRRRSSTFARRTSRCPRTALARRTHCRPRWPRSSSSVPFAWSACISTRPARRRSSSTCHANVVAEAKLSPGAAVSIFLPPAALSHPRPDGDRRRCDVVAAVSAGSAARSSLAGAARARPARRLRGRARAVPVRAVVHDPGEERAGQGRRIRRAAAIPAIFRDGCAPAVDRQYAVRRYDRDRHHGAARVRVRVCAHAIVHALARLLPRRRR